MTRWRAAFLLLVAANLALFAWTRLVDPEEGIVDPEPMRRQVQPDRIRVVPGPDATAKPASSAPSPAGATPVSATAPAAPAPAACVEWGGFALAEASRAEKALEPLALGARLAQHRTEETAGWWAFIPPQGNRAGAQKKVAELKALGVEEFFVLQDEGPQRWAISLGVFRTEDAAKSRLDALRARGVRSAVIGQRDTQVAKIWYQVKGAEPALQDRLRELATQYPGTEVRACP